MKNRPLRQRIGFALAGITEAWCTERSVRSHVVSTGVTYAALTLLHPAPIWWAVVTLAIALVLAAELLNAALEALADHLHPDIHPRIGAVKDMAAGAVLIAAMAALAVAGLFILTLL